MTNVMSRFACPCCGNLTLASEPPGSFELCPVCWWEDDSVQFDDPDRAFGANRVSLREARENYKQFGVCDADGRGHVRPPMADELPNAG